jgi:hypothetical protein
MICGLISDLVSAGIVWFCVDWLMLWCFIALFMKPCYYMETRIPSDLVDFTGLLRTIISEWAHKGGYLVLFARWCHRPVVFQRFLASQPADKKTQRGSNLLVEKANNSIFIGFNIDSIKFGLFLV